MARWIKADGTDSVLVPKARKWTLAELQAAVGGYIEMMPGVAPLRMVLNEEGRVRGLPVNHVATEVLHQYMAGRLGVTVAQLAGEVGRTLRYLPVLRGDVLLLDPAERL